jgi:hypothetical protein
MRQFARIVLALAAIIVIAACTQTPASPEYVVPLVSTAVTGSPEVKTDSPLSSTHLTGDHEVPARPTNAQGQALIKVSDDGLSITYKLIASNIENVVASHIHIGSPTVNGPIAVFLFGNVPAGGGRHDGILAEGTLTAANLIGPMLNHPMADLIAEIRAGNAYVNVHTNDGVAPTNTGPGDFPGGEIRGQIRAKK